MRVLILLALLGAAIAVPRNIQRIVGGSPTTVQEYPFMANMQYCYWSTLCYQSCGGTLITSKDILSAAHCYYLDYASDWRVKLGTSFASSGGSSHDVSKLTIHERYSNTYLDNDVAIVRLADPAVYSDSVQPALIPGPNYNLPDGTPMMAVGWGTLQSGGSAPEQLHHVEVYQINQELCAERYAYLKTQPGYQNWPDITDAMICVGVLDEGGKDACQGDSGGPLVHNKNVCIGATSWGYGCADAFYPGVNTRINQFTAWITNVASQ